MAWTDQARDLNTFDPAWTRAARLVWRKVDQLSTEQELDPAVLATLGARLQKFEYLSGLPRIARGHVAPSITEGALP